MSARLEHCPECGAGWPVGPDYSLRGCGWLQGLERHVSPTNSDVRIHDGVGGRNRFLQLELKGPREPWPIQKGQLWDLIALAGQSNWTVRVLRGTSMHIELYPVGPGGMVVSSPIHTHGEAMRHAVDLWLRGALWRDAEASLASAPAAKHVCGWGRVSGVWTCVQDYYSLGYDPESACGATLPDYR